MKTISTLTLLLALAMPACATQSAARGAQVIDQSANPPVSFVPETHKREAAFDEPRALSRIAFDRIMDRTERSSTHADMVSRAR
jgi:hypothetical protein